MCEREIEREGGERVASCGGERVLLMKRVSK